MKKMFLLVVSGMLAACATPTPPKAPVALTTKEADIYEALLRYQFARNASAAQQSAGSYFIEIQKADPGEALLRRFAGHTPPVKRASEARHARNSAIYDRQTRQRSLIFEVGPIQWIDKETVEIEAGYYEGNLSSSGNTYRLKRQKGKWKVVSDVMEWISEIRKPAESYPVFASRDYPLCCSGSLADRSVI